MQIQSKKCPYRIIFVKFPSDNFLFFFLKKKKIFRTEKEKKIKCFYGSFKTIVRSGDKLGFQVRQWFVTKLKKTGQGL